MGFESINVACDSYSEVALHSNVESIKYDNLHSEALKKLVVQNSHLYSSCSDIINGLKGCKNTSSQVITPVINHRKKNLTLI